MLSCIREGLDECPPTVNVGLTFTYTGDTGEATRFARHIDHVTLMVFDRDGYQVQTHTYNKNQLTQRQGTDLLLDPGTYNIICWGNANTDTELASCETLDQGRVHHPNLTANREIPTNSHLYYGNYTVEVPATGIAQGDILFRGAHINMEVYIRNQAATDANTPLVRARNLMPQYNMHMDATMANATTYQPKTTWNADRRVYQSIFQVLRFANDNPVVVEIEQQTGAAPLRIDLKQYMAANRIIVNGLNEATVPILIEYTDLGVEIRVPEWMINEVEPGAR